MVTCVYAIACKQPLAGEALNVFYDKSLGLMLYASSVSGQQLNGWLHTSVGFGGTASDGAHKDGSFRTSATETKLAISTMNLRTVPSLP